MPFVLIGVFRYQLLSDPDEADRRRSIDYESTSEKPEEMLAPWYPAHSGGVVGNDGDDRVGQPCQLMDVRRVAVFDVDGTLLRGDCLWLAFEALNC